MSPVICPPMNRRSIDGGLDLTADVLAPVVARAARLTPLSAVYGAVGTPAQQLAAAWGDFVWQWEAASQRVDGTAYDVTVSESDGVVTLTVTPTDDPSNPRTETPPVKEGETLAAAYTRFTDLVLGDA